MPPRILIVEDERITAEDLHDILTELGYEVTAIVSSGADAIAEVQRNPPDLALMDIRIEGDMDGTETARVLNERFGIPVVYLTAHADRETLQRAKRAKPLGYLVKPFQESELQASLEIALHRHQHDRNAQQRQAHVTDVLSALLLGVISVDNGEIVLVFNPAAEQLTGFEKAEALNSPVRKVFRLADIRSGAGLDLPIAEAIKGSSVVELGRAALMTKDGITRPVTGNISPMRGVSGDSIGAVIVFEESPESSEGSVDILSSDFKVGANEIQFGKFQIISESEQMKRVLTFALRIARTEASTILLEGESGTGKDLLAQFIHYSSDRRMGPFVPVNCSAIPDNLIESELFGHQRGAFSEAKQDKKGLFEIADGGTLFLDEIAELSPAMQAKLLRVLEEQSFRRLGSVDDIPVNIRVVAATNRTLADRVQAGDFRLDLFHRLSVIQIVLPPLRDRKTDVLPLAKLFLEQNNQRYRSKAEGISEEAAQMLLNHDWPGNVRELRNVMERAMLVEETRSLRSSSIHFVAMPSMRGGREPQKDPWSLKESERALVVKALEKTGGNQSKAARLLGITRDMLRYRMKKMRLRSGQVIDMDA